MCSDIHAEDDALADDITSPKADIDSPRLGESNHLACTNMTQPPRPSSTPKIRVKGELLHGRARESHQCIRVR